MAWLNPVRDYLDAVKSGAEAGLALARVQNDKSEAAAKLAQSALAAADERDLGYARIGAARDEAQASAAEKLQAAMAQQSALTDWRNAQLEQKGQAADALNAYRGTRLDQGQQGLDLRSAAADALDAYRKSRLDQGQQRIDFGYDKMKQQADQFDRKLAQNAEWLKAQYGNKNSKMTDVEKMVFQQALNQQTQAKAALMKSYQSPDAMNAASNTLNQAQSVIDNIKSKHTPVAADALDTTFSPVMGLRQAADEASMPSPAAATTGTSAADALTTPAATTNTTTNPYQVGKRYGNLRYLGGDPNDEKSWEPAE